METARLYRAIAFNTGSEQMGAVPISNVSSYYESNH